MNQLGEFKGLCPLCYVPVKHDDDSREIRVQNTDQMAVYHASCLNAWIADNTPADANTTPLGVTLLDTYKYLLIGNNDTQRETWKASMAKEWEGIGQSLKGMRERHKLTLTSVAKTLGISPSRLSRFENGYPIRDAKLIESAYFLIFKNKLLERRLEQAQGQGCVAK